MKRTTKTYFYNINTSQRGTHIYKHTHQYQVVKRSHKIGRMRSITYHRILELCFCGHESPVHTLTEECKVNQTGPAERTRPNREESSQWKENKSACEHYADRHKDHQPKLICHDYSWHQCHLALSPQKNHPVDHIRCRSWGPLSWENWAICDTLFLLLQLLSSDV